jgi:hypothetical protein
MRGHMAVPPLSSFRRRRPAKRGRSEAENLAVTEHNAFMSGDGESTSYHQRRFRFPRFQVSGDTMPATSACSVWAYCVYLHANQDGSTLAAWSGAVAYSRLRRIEE